MKSLLAVATAIGALIATVLLVVEPLTDFSLLSLEWPGIAAAYVFWGVTGGSAFMGIAIAWVVNALIYALGALCVLSAVKLLIKSC